jgi:large subunit ribosomal protein L4
MTTMNTYDVAKSAKGEKEISLDLGDQLLYRTLKDAVVMYQSNRRQGDAHTKNRTELAGHAKKPWKQKKTGRARAGDRRSPLWVGGATTFGPRNKRNWYYSLPKKQRLVALRSALLGKLQDQEVHEASGLNFATPSTSAARAILDGCGMRGTVLVITANYNENVWKSFRNLSQVSICPAAEANAHMLLAHKWVLAEEGALENIVSRLAKPKASQGE